MVGQDVEAKILSIDEEGKIRLNDQVATYIPEFKGIKVAVPRPGPAGQPAPAAGRGGRGHSTKGIDLRCYGT
jgi:hypothetical protein